MAESVMREFKQAYDDFKVVETKSGIFWRRVQGRSLWCSVHTQQMVALAEKGDRMTNDAMKAQVIEQWSGITQTKLTEDGVREERVEEESRRSFNRKMSGETCWDKLCASDIHAQKHQVQGHASPWAVRSPLVPTFCRCKKARPHCGAFGVYGNTFEDGCRFTEKSSLVIGDLLRNAPLWALLLKHMPSAKVTDSYLAGIMQRICCSMRRTNTSKLTDAMFIVWWNKAVHHSMSHVRELATYPELFRYRVSKLDEYQKIALEELYKKVARCNREPSTETAASGATGVSAAEQPAEMGTSGDDAEQRAQSQTEMATAGACADVEQRLARIKSAPSVFSKALDEPESDVHTPPRKMVKLDEKLLAERHSASCKIWAITLKTPPLPCARGGIKKHCETHGAEQEHGSASGLRVCVERASGRAELSEEDFLARGEAQKTTKSTNASCGGSQLP